MVEKLIIYVERRLDAGWSVSGGRSAGTIPENPSSHSSRQFVLGFGVAGSSVGVGDRDGDGDRG